ncbi:MAG: precorrin-6A reductase [Peptostreptococcus porci]|uniref:Precorrin-6A reductase n=1 Tax=Peptostreptococcus porci TaxID=2652282 RepID=A0A6N7XFZ0_9FIRM|nr:precorrin-6A reductase [Peptostreptococcus porci]MDD7182652.1 precorrin-6A reductase [Peptostreptococcus porci]MDY2795361.1 precorrin-6A reductase [Peptostreptococcus porci]MDY4128272.1 precorrin-6A reductase [Peptostreptococcus porci]MDY5479176.1 precorrin-6A reductase [Peptostreptococcus porci]MDY5963807.1 precorrin-6A reductase [Peptostreptococcus porci]
MILVLGGTSDSLKICDRLYEIGISEFVLSVATEYGKELASSHAKKIINGKMDKDEMVKYISENGIRQVIDATHPYAIDVSRNAMDACEEADIKYIRFERKSLLEEIRYQGEFIVDSIEEACDMVMKNNSWENVFIATGSKNLGTYVKLLKSKRLVARVLPTSEVLRSCEAMGLNADNLLALKGPFSKEINVALLKHAKVDVVITKESGYAGGFLDKIDACDELGLPIIIIKRKTIDYQRMVHEISEIQESIIFG